MGGFVVMDLSRELNSSLEIVKKWKDDIDAKSMLSHPLSALFLLLSNDHFNFFL